MEKQNGLKGRLAYTQKEVAHLKEQLTKLRGNNPQRSVSAFLSLARVVHTEERMKKVKGMN